MPAWSTLTKGTIMLGAAATAATLWTSRREITRYLVVKRIDDHPERVGDSITPQGNHMALGKSEFARKQDRDHAGIRNGPPISPDMPDMGIMDGH